MNILWFLNEFWFNGNLLYLSESQKFKTSSSSLYFQIELAHPYKNPFKLVISTKIGSFSLSRSIFSKMSIFLKSVSRVSSSRPSYRRKIWIFGILLHFVILSHRLDVTSVPSCHIALELEMLIFIFSSKLCNFKNIESLPGDL